MSNNMNIEILELKKEAEELLRKIEILEVSKILPKEVVYPIYYKSTKSSLVVKLTDFETGEVVVNSGVQKIGDKTNNWIEKNDKNYWQQLEVCPITGFFEGQAVLAWDDEDIFGRRLVFYSVKANEIYVQYDMSKTCYFNNYEVYEGNYIPWMLEAFNKIHANNG